MWIIWMMIAFVFGCIVGYAIDDHNRDKKEIERLLNRQDELVNRLMQVENELLETED